MSQICLISTYIFRKSTIFHVSTPNIYIFDIQIKETLTLTLTGTDLTSSGCYSVPTMGWFRIPKYFIEHCNPNNPVVMFHSLSIANRQTSGESASLPQYLGCNMVFDMRLRVTFLRRKTVSLQSNIAHCE